jgi:hypothetical protein
MQCQNKLKQLSLAMHNYHDANNEFRANGDQFGGMWDGGNDTTGPNSSATNAGPYLCRHSSIWVWLLPFIEQTALFEEWIDEYDNSPYCTQGWAGSTPGGTYMANHTPPLVPHPDLGTAPGIISRIAAFLRTADANFMACPSDGNGNKALSDGNFPQRSGNYVVSAGEWTASGNIWGVVGTWRGWSRGPVHPYIPTTISEISDGTSNTALFTERCAGTNALTTADQVITGAADYRTHIALDADGGSTAIGALGGTAPNVCNTVTSPDGANPGGADNTTNGFNPYMCLNVRSGNVIPEGYRKSSWTGTQWYCCYGPFTWANFFLPPNSPSCGSNRTVPSAGDASIIPPTSYHTGGVNVSICDGTVRFISDTVDTGDHPDARSLHVDRFGPSPYGVWGAFGSKAGGESISHP